MYVQYDMQLLVILLRKHSVYIDRCMEMLHILRQQHFADLSPHKKFLKPYLSLIVYKLH